MILETETHYYVLIPGSVWQWSTPDAGDVEPVDLEYVGRLELTSDVNLVGTEPGTYPGYGVLFKFRGSELCRVFSAEVVVSQFTPTLPQTLTSDHVSRMVEQTKPKGGDETGTGP